MTGPSEETHLRTPRWLLLPRRRGSPPQGTENRRVAGSTRGTRQWDVWLPQRLVIHTFGRALFPPVAIPLVTFNSHLRFVDTSDDWLTRRNAPSRSRRSIPGSRHKRSRRARYPTAITWPATRRRPELRVFRRSRGEGAVASRRSPPPFLVRADPSKFCFGLMPCAQGEGPSAQSEDPRPSWIERDVHARGGFPRQRIRLVCSIEPRKQSVYTRTPRLDSAVAAETIDRGHPRRPTPRTDHAPRRCGPSRGDVKGPPTRSTMASRSPQASASSCRGPARKRTRRASPPRASLPLACAAPASRYRLPWRLRVRPRSGWSKRAHLGGARPGISSPGGR
jgi:hypothetical protein